MNHRPLILTALVCALGAVSLGGCSSEPEPTEANSIVSTDTATYELVNAERAKKIMDTEDDYVIIDVRTQAEYDEGHVPGAMLLPHDSIAKDAACALPDTDQLILVYCRSGNRSKQAAQVLTDQGYTNAVEFGGINDWSYEVEQQRCCRASAPGSIVFSLSNARQQQRTAHRHIRSMQRHERRRCHHYGR